MTDLIPLVEATFKANSSLAALLPGGIYSEEDAESRLGITPSDFPSTIYDTNGRVKTFLWHVWSSSFEQVRTEPMDEERQMLDVYVVSDFGYNDIRPAVALLKATYHRYSWLPDDYKFAWSRHFMTEREIRAKDFLFAPYSRVVFEFVLRR